MDVSEDVGKGAAKGLQEEYAQKDVLFVLADVTKREELVSGMGQLAIHPSHLASSYVALLYFRLVYFLF